MCPENILSSHFFHIDQNWVLATTWFFSHRIGMFPINQLNFPAINAYVHSEIPNNNNKLLLVERSKQVYYHHDISWCLFLLLWSRFLLFLVLLRACTSFAQGDGRVLYWISTITMVSRKLCGKGAFGFRWCSVMFCHVLSAIWLSQATFRMSIGYIG